MAQIYETWLFKPSSKRRINMPKVAINVKMGEFGLTRKSFERFLELKKIDWFLKYDPMMGNDQYFRKDNQSEDGWIQPYFFFKNRGDPLLIKAIEENLKAEEMVGTKIVEVPEDVSWHIGANDQGCEWVAENHRTWY